MKFKWNNVGSSGPLRKYNKVVSIRPLPFLNDHVDNMHFNSLIDVGEGRLHACAEYEEVLEWPVTVFTLKIVEALKEIKADYMLIIHIKQLKNRKKYIYSCI